MMNPKGLGGGKDQAPRLGRGLAALLGEPAPPQGSLVQTLPLDQLEPGPFQPRQAMQSEHLSELADSIRARGVLQPLLARAHPAQPGTYQIIAGERRWRAAQLAGLHTVPVLVLTLSDKEALAAALVENLQREDLNAVEEAEGYKRLIEEYAMTQEQLAEAVGKSRSHVANTLRLLHLPRTVLMEVQHGALSAGHARALLAHPAPERAALAVIAGNLNVRQTEALVQKAKLPPEPPRYRDPDIEQLARDLSAHLGLRVEIGFDGAKGSIKIQCKTIDQFDALIALLRR
jgi:ParB family chromosome partitioning protein